MGRFVSAGFSMSSFSLASSAICWRMFNASPAMIVRAAATRTRSSADFLSSFSVWRRTQMRVLSDMGHAALQARR